MTRVEPPHEFWAVVASLAFGAWVLLVVVAGVAIIISALVQLMI